MQDLSEYTELTTYEAVMEAWDGSSVILRSVKDDPSGPETFLIYPQVGKGYIYPEFSVRHLACLQSFFSEQTALMWARGHGYSATTIR